MTEWEYREMVTDSAWGNPYPSTMQALEKLGKEGWELVEKKKGNHTIFNPGEGLVFGIPCTVLTLKRPKPIGKSQ